MGPPTSMRSSVTSEHVRPPGRIQAQALRAMYANCTRTVLVLYWNCAVAGPRAQVKAAEEKKWADKNELFLQLELSRFEYPVLFQVPPSASACLAFWPAWPGGLQAPPLTSRGHARGPGLDDHGDHRGDFLAKHPSPVHAKFGHGNGNSDCDCRRRMIWGLHEPPSLRISPSPRIRLALAHVASCTTQCRR